MKDNHEVVMKAVSMNGDALEDASEKLKADCGCERPGQIQGSETAERQ